MEAGDVLDAVPADVEVAEVAANDREGWVVVRQADGAGRSGPYDLWRARPDEALLVGEVGQLSSLDVEGMSTGLAMSGVRCDNGGSGARCSGLVLLLDHEGRIDHEVTLWQGDGTAMGSAAALVGETAEGLWVRSDGSLTLISGDGDVANVLPSPGGMECILDGELFAVRAAGGPPTGESDELSTEVRNASSGHRGYEVLAYQAGGWQPNDVVDVDVVEGTLVSELCAGGRIDVHDVGGPLLGSWQPDEGWTAVGLGTGPGTDPTSGDVEVVPVRGTGQFVLREDGSLLRRREDGVLSASGIEFPSPAADGVPVVPVVAASERFTIACRSPEPGTTECDLSEEG